MAAMSQNGYAGSPARENIHTLTVAGTNIRIPVRAGPAGDLLMWAAARYDVAARRRAAALSFRHCLQ